MRVRLVTAGGGQPWEAHLVAACQQGSLPAEVVQRCFDLGDLLAAAAAGQAEAALVAASMRWLDREAVARLAASGLVVVGVVPAGDEQAERRLRQLGIVNLAQDTDPPGALVDLAMAALVGDPQGGGWHSQARAYEPAGATPGPPPGPAAGAGPAPPAPAPAAPPPSGAFVVVWGPRGAPGRTTVAVNLAFEAAPLVGETLLVDADTYGGSVAQVLGFLDDVPGLAWAARLAGRGELDVARLWQSTRKAAADGPRVLPGLPRAELWTEVRPTTWETLIELFRAAFPLTIADVGFCLEEEEELLYDQVRLRRNAVARMALQRADAVVAVARADPVGLHDFVRGFQELRRLVRPERVCVVVNQTRTGVFAGDPTEQIRPALARYAGIEPAIFIPYDRSSMDAALMVGRALREVRQGSPAQRAIAELARMMFVPPEQATPRRRRRGRASAGGPPPAGSPPAGPPPGPPRPPFPPDPGGPPPAGIPVDHAGGPPVQGARALR